MTPKVVLHFENVLFLISSIAMFLVFIPSFLDGLDFTLANHRIYATLQYFYFRIPLLPDVRASLYLGVHF